MRVQENQSQKALPKAKTATSRRKFLTETRELENVFLLPHVGSATRETRDAMGFRALDNLDAVFAGREPRDRVA